MNSIDPRASFSRRHALAWLAAGCGLQPLGATAGRPALMLAQPYEGGLDLAAFAVSEKYDGLRGYWDGRALWTRGGERVNTPPGFTDRWPRQPLDGELWAGRGRFELAVGTARTHSPDARAWRAMRFMVFDLPAHPGTYRERYRGLLAVLATGGDARAQAIEQLTLRDEASLRALLDQTVREGGEGLMLRRWDSPHRPGRSADLLKYKPEQDDDARVVGHLPGQGRHAGAMGALLVETPRGLRFRLGTGFSDAQRRQPPAIGSWVSYRYRSRTEAGVPRFATFLRARPDLVD